MIKNGVIRGFKTVFTPFSLDKQFFFYFFFELMRSLDHILFNFYQLPFSFDVLIESKAKVCLRFLVGMNELNEIISALNALEDYLDRYFLQFTDYSIQGKS